MFRGGGGDFVRYNTGPKESASIIRELKEPLSQKGGKRNKKKPVVVVRPRLVGLRFTSEAIFFASVL